MEAVVVWGFQQSPQSLSFLSNTCFSILLVRCCPTSSLVVHGFFHGSQELNVWWEERKDRRQAKSSNLVKKRSASLHTV